ncbi:DNA repair protein RecO [Pseudofulvibacter geojedonensis]|uniref:DNA repair protein RecO n=1 Tax=Pseudofulvibacter geojedonensis TaxID=1123758 RepID=A0ABW3I424_9FLAO
MLVNTTGIVLGKIKYQEHSLIVNCYTKEYGLQSYILHHILRKKKGKINPAYFLALSQLELKATHKKNQSIHKINDVRLLHTYTSLHTNVYKSSVALFLAEVLQSVLKEEEENSNLYNFLETSLLWYDLNEFNANFHILFLLKLSQHLGLYPNIKNIDQHFFLHDANYAKINTLKELLGINFDTLSSIKMTAQLRQDILQEILHYFSVNLGSFKQPKSLAILHNVFN